MTPEQAGLLITKYSEVGKRTQCLVAQLTASTKSLSELVSRQGLTSKIISCQCAHKRYAYARSNIVVSKGQTMPDKKIEAVHIPASVPLPSSP